MDDLVKLSKFWTFFIYGRNQMKINLNKSVKNA